MEIDKEIENDNFTFLNRKYFDKQFYIDNDVNDIIHIACDKLKSQQFLSQYQSFKQQYEKKNRKNQLNLRINLENLMQQQKNLKIFRMIYKKFLQKNLNVDCQYTRDIWMILTYQQNNQNNYIQQFQNLFQEIDHAYSIIDKDVKRTFSILNNSQELTLFLQTYSKKNSEIGYCQGMNFLAAALLNFLKMEDAFKIFSHIIESILPLDYFKNMESLEIHSQIFGKLIQEYCPQIQQKLQEYQLDCQLFTVSWFICLFSKNIPLQILKIFWDNIFYFGVVGLFKCGIVILKIQEQKIIKSQNIQEFQNIITNDLQNMNDQQIIQKKINEIYFNKKLFKIIMIFYKKESKPRIVNGQQKTNIEKSKKNCNKLSPVCLTQMCKNKLERPQFLIYKTDKFNIIDNYIRPQLLRKIRYNDQSDILSQNLIQKENQIMIQRQKHICDDNYIEPKFYYIFYQKILLKKQDDQDSQSTSEQIN